LILALNLNKRMLLILDDIENEETKNEESVNPPNNPKSLRIF